MPRPKQYLEGQEETENFESGMKASFNVHKDEVVGTEEKRRRKKPLPATRVYANRMLPTRTCF
jgi:hypothetical protein